MPAYVIAVMTIDDTEKYSKYTDRTPDIIKRYGGKFLTRGQEVIALEGSAPAGRMVLLEFPRAKDVQDWHADPEYREVMEIRLASSTMHQLIMQEGEENTDNPAPKL